MLISSRGGKGWVFPKVRRRPLQPGLPRLSPRDVWSPAESIHPCFTTAALQGGWENDETLEAAAMRETVEEAGVRGRLEVRKRWLRRPADAAATS